MKSFVWYMTAFFAIVGALTAVFGILGANGAPQEAAAAAIGMCCAVIPYIFARAITEMYAEGSKNQKEPS